MEFIEITVGSPAFALLMGRQKHLLFGFNEIFEYAELLSVQISIAEGSMR